MGINPSCCVGLEAEQVKVAWPADLGEERVDLVALAWQKGVKPLET